MKLFVPFTEYWKQWKDCYEFDIEEFKPSKRQYFTIDGHPFSCVINKDGKYGLFKVIPVMGGGCEGLLSREMAPICYDEIKIIRLYPSPELLFILARKGDNWAAFDMSNDHELTKLSDEESFDKLYRSIFRTVSFGEDATDDELFQDNELIQDINDLKSSNKETIIGLLRSTKRKNIERVIKYMETCGFFEAPASTIYHNNIRGGLAQHSLDVYHEAMNLNSNVGLPVDSVTLCALLHDICKGDQYYMDDRNEPRSVNAKKKKGHGIRSMFILTRCCQLPLNYDEAMAIWWHMGDNENKIGKNADYTEIYEGTKSIQLCNLICKADGIAAHKK